MQERRIQHRKQGHGGMWPFWSEAVRCRESVCRTCIFSVTRGQHSKRVSGCETTKPVEFEQINPSVDQASSKVAYLLLPWRVASGDTHSKHSQTVRLACRTTAPCWNMTHAHAHRYAHHTAWYHVLHSRNCQHILDCKHTHHTCSEGSQASHRVRYSTREEISDIPWIMTKT